MDQDTKRLSHTLVGLRELPDENAEGSFGAGYDARFARAALDCEQITLRPWSALRVAPGAVRTFAAGPDGLEFLAFGTHTEDDGKIVPL